MKFAINPRVFTLRVCMFTTDIIVSNVTFLGVCRCMLNYSRF